MSEFHVVRDEASAAFFDAGREGQLLIKRCVACGRSYPPGQERCADSDELEWQPASGAATLVTWSVDHGGAVSPALTSALGAGEVIGVVELAEGPWMNTAIPGVDPADLHDGMSMQVRFVELGGGEPVPVFVPAS